MKLPAKPLDSRSLPDEHLVGFSEPLNILVGHLNARKVSKRLRSHTCSGRFPAGSFIQAGKLVVSSPELCFVQMASELTIPKLVTLGYELCGGYRLEPGSKQDRGFHDDAPLTSATKLEAYIARATGIKGRKNALRAIRFITDGSASPMETALAILLTFPYRLGGYGFPLPVLNRPIKVPVGIRKNSGRSELHGDLYWPDAQVDIEYDSDTYHTGAARITRDAIRRNALSSAGVTMITVTSRQVDRTASLREVADEMSRLLGKRLQCRMPEFAERHITLRSQVLPEVREYH